MEHENYTFRGQKVKISLQSPKTEFGAQNQYGRVIYPMDIIHRPVILYGARKTIFSEVKKAKISLQNLDWFDVHGLRNIFVCG
jgi:hypothetical protein